MCTRSELNPISDITPEAWKQVLRTVADHLRIIGDIFIGVSLVKYLV